MGAKVDFDFPILIKNNRNMWRKVGGIWFPPNSALSLTEAMFLAHEELLLDDIRDGRLSVVTEEVEAEVEVETVEVDDNEADEGDEVVEEKGIIDQFVDGDLHWAAAKKLIQQIDDPNELEKILVDVKFHELSEDHVLHKAVLERIEQVSQ